MADCGDDAHPHVRSCAAKPAGADIFFGSAADFRSSNRRRQAKALLGLLASLPAAQQREALQAVALELQDLELPLDISQLGALAHGHPLPAAAIAGRPARELLF